MMQRSFDASSLHLQPCTISAPRPSCWQPCTISRHHRRTSVISENARLRQAGSASTADSAAQPQASDRLTRDAQQCVSVSTPQRLARTAAAGAIAALGVLPMCALPAAAIGVHAEPANALSLPTWAIHVSSVVEWIAAMGLVWRYAEVSGEPRWKGLTWGMMPLLGGAMCACTHHFFYNDPQLDIVVALQAFLTCLGNATCWWAAARIYSASKSEQGQA